MPSERVQRRIDGLLDQAEEAVAAMDWSRARDAAEAVLVADPDNEDARTFLAMAERVGGANGPQTPVPEQSAPEAIPPKSDASTPTSFANDRYQVSKFLGEGGKKRVYLAHDTLLDREVAFALIKTEGFDQTSMERISREAQAMGRLGVHPNIVAVLDLGEEDDGSPYMVTELMGGGDIEGLLDSVGAAPRGRPGGEHDHNLESGQTRGPAPTTRTEGLSLERTIEIGKAVCEGLEFAHARGIVHRDLKPGNVWLTDDGTAKIGDFGLAMLTDRSRLTRDAMMVGTVSYMPPEQATGGDITQKADLYSLGAMLYEMVTGRPPFLGDDEIAIIGQHINTPPVAPTWHNGDCPRPLEALIMRLLSKDPSERPDSAQDVFNALDAIDLAARGETVEREANSLESLAGGVFVGRQAEMDQLKAALEDVLGGRGRLLTLVGEPGIGKTRTSEELATYAGLRGAQVLWGRCYETGGQPPYWPWIQAIRSYVRGADAEELRRQMGSSASVIAEIVTDVKDRLPEAGPPPGMDDPAAARFRLFDAFTSFLRTASQDRPLVLILDDLHWSDEPSLSLLEFVAREIGQSRVLVIGTYRDMELNRRHPLTITLGDLRRERLFERVLLRGLTQQDIARFIDIAAGIEPPAELSATVHRHTEGNPLFVTEVVRELVQSGELAENRASGESTWSVRIPEGVREVIGRRLDRLSERANEVLTTAAVVGRDFTLDALKELAEDISESRLLDVLDEALDAKIIEELSDTLGHYQFTHALMQETLTSELSLTRRVRLHALIGETLERLYGDEADEHAPELTIHFAAAEAHLGSDRLIHHSLVAGKKSVESYGFDDAVRHFDVAVRSGEERESNGMRDANARRELTEAYAGRAVASAPLFGLELRQRALSDIDTAFDRYLELGDLDAALDVAQTPVILGGLIGAVDFWRKAVEAAPSDSEAAGWLWGRYGTALMDEHKDYVRAREAAERSLNIGTALGHPAIRARSMANLTQLSHRSMIVSDITRYGPQTIELSRKANDPMSELRCGTFLSEAYLVLGDVARAEETALQIYELATGLGNAAWGDQAAAILAQVYGMLGQWADSDKWREIMGARSAFIAYFAPRRADTGPSQDALPSEPIPESGTNMVSGAVSISAAAMTALNAALTGDSTSIVESLDTISTGMDRVSVHNDFRVEIGLVVALCASEIHDKQRLDSIAQDDLDHEWRVAGRFGLTRDRVAGRVTAARGDTEAASTYFNEGLSFCRAAGYRPELAWTCSDYAEMLLDRDDPSSASGISDRKKAIELQGEALAITQELGMRPLTERILARRELLRA